MKFYKPNDIKMTGMSRCSICR